MANYAWSSPWYRDRTENRHGHYRFSEFRHSRTRDPLHVTWTIEYLSRIEGCRGRYACYFGNIVLVGDCLSLDRY